MTASHCCDGSDASAVTVRAGTTQYNHGGSVYEVKRVEMHPKYDDNTLENDACVLVLAQDIDDPM